MTGPSCKERFRSILNVLSGANVEFPPVEFGLPERERERERRGAIGRHKLQQRGKKRWQAASSTT